MSRPKSGRGATAPGTARVAAARGVYVQAPKSDIYVALLGVALGAMILGCVLLLVVLKSYDFKTKVSALPTDRVNALTVVVGNAHSENLFTVRL